MKEGRMKIIGISAAIVILVVVAIYFLSSPSSVTGNIVRSFPSACAYVGDANGDGRLSTEDVTLIRSFVLGTAVPTWYQTSISDLSSNGTYPISVTTLDSSLLNYYLNNRSNTFSLCSNPNLCIDTDYNSQNLDGVNPNMIGSTYYQKNVSASFVDQCVLYSVVNGYGTYSPAPGNVCTGENCNVDEQFCTFHGRATVARSCSNCNAGRCI